MTVWLVTFYSTGERWHTCICANEAAIARALKTYNITEMTGKHDEVREFINPKDKTQKATVWRHVVLE